VGHQSLRRLGGRYVNVTADANFDGLASWEASTGSIRVVLGNVGGDPTTEVPLVNLGAITTAASARVRVERIRNTEEAALAGMTVVTDATFNVTGGELRIPISGSEVWDAHAVTVTFSQGNNAPSAPGSLTIR